MTCIEKQIEANIIAAFRALNVADMEVVGTWNVAPAETSATLARLSVKVSPRGYSRYTVCEATLAATLELAVRVDTDPEGARLERCASAVAGLLHKWNMNVHDEAKTALSVAGEAAVGGVKVGAGEGPDREGGNWYVTFPMDITAFIKHTQTQGE